MRPHRSGTAEIFTLSQREGKPIAFEPGMKFALREGRRTVRAGVVLTTGA